MSKPVTNEEVEDVLSSIRRLVSEDKRPLAGLRNPAQAPGAARPPDAVQGPDAGADRLVLTPALRVTDPEPLDLGAVARRSWAPSADGGEAPLALSGMEAPMAAENATTASDTPPPDARDTLEALVHDTLAGDENEARAETEGRARPPMTEAPMIEDAIEEEGDWQVQDSPDWRIGQDRAGEDFMAEWVRQPDGDHAPDDHASDDPDAGPGGPAPDVATAEEARDKAPRDAALEDTAMEDTASTPASDSPFFFETAPRPARPRTGTDAGGGLSTAPLTAKIAALEAAMGQIANEWEPDGDEIEAIAAKVTPALAWEDDVPLDGKGVPLKQAPRSASRAEAQAVTPAPQTDAQNDASADARVPGKAAPDDAAPGEAASAEESSAQATPEQASPEQADVEQADVEQADVAPQSDTEAAAPDDQLLDEEALRRLVGEIVRAELQGALGERITRNVRKLVRREIHRALTAQDME